MSSVTLPIAEGNWAEVGAWLVKEGDVVSEGKVMMRYSCGGSSRQLEALGPLTPLALGSLPRARSH